MRARLLFAAFVAVGFLTSGVGLCSVSHADTSSVSSVTRADEHADEADRLFEEGRALVAAGKIAEGCTALAKSQRIDPSAGTLLNLALCHESQGKLEEARAELRESLVLATSDRREDRAAIARAHLNDLDPPPRPAPVGLDLVVTAAVFFAGGRVTRLSRARSRDRDRALRDTASRAP